MPRRLHKGHNPLRRNFSRRASSRPSSPLPHWRNRVDHHGAPDGVDVLAADNDGGGGDVCGDTTAGVQASATINATSGPDNLESASCSAGIARVCNGEERKSKQACLRILFSAAIRDKGRFAEGWSSRAYRSSGSGSAPLARGALTSCRWRADNQPVRVVVHRVR